MLTAIIVGAGHRSLAYAHLAEIKPDALKIVGVADILPERRKYTAVRFGFGEDMCFETAEELAARGKLADVIINGTMDQQHVPTTLPLLEAGYDVLLEKPFAVNEEELQRLADTARRTRRKVMICHVLRYAPFYAEIKRRIVAGEVGRIMDIQTAEHVSYHHFSACYVRGKWAKKAACGASSLLAKCCHDIDLLTWFKSGIAPAAVESMGGLLFFNRANAPEKSGNYCLIDCPIESTCDFSVRRLHLENPVRWRGYIWPKSAYCPEANTPEYREKALRDPSHPHARCVWKCDNDQPDYQVVNVTFADGAIATHTMAANSARPMRKIHIIGTEGEIQGIFDDNRFTLRHRDVRPGGEYTEEVVDLGNMGDTTGAFGDHGGGDLRLAMDFVEFAQGGKPSISCTSLEDSVNGHRIVFAADRAMAEQARQFNVDGRFVSGLKR